MNGEVKFFDNSKKKLRGGIVSGGGGGGSGGGVRADGNLFVKIQKINKLG